MSLEASAETRIRSLIESHRVLLFMKGDRGQPQCGFSAQVVQILDRLLPDYATVDVLSDPEIREGIKQFSSWPTIPQLYVEGEFLGGCDIVKDLFGSGELQERLGVASPGAGGPPEIQVTEAAAQALGEIAAQRPGQVVHLGIDARFENQLYLGPESPGDLRVETGGIVLAIDPVSATRAAGVVIDAVDTPQGPGFAIQNPNAPTAVRQLPAAELAAWRDAGRSFRLLDVRTPEERSRAAIPGAELLDADLAAQLEQLERDTLLVFHCHYGGRSQAAAEHFAALGFVEVYNVVGGIDAWSREVDPSVPRY